MYEPPRFPPSQPGNYSQQPSSPHLGPRQVVILKHKGYSSLEDPTSQPISPPKKRRTGCWVTLILIFVMLVSAGIGSYWLLNKSGTQLSNVLATGPQKTLDTYCDGLKNKNAQELYNTLDAAHQKQTSVDDIQQTLDDLAAGGSVKRCTYNNVQINGSTATATVTITLGSSGDKPYSAPFKLTKENGDWKLSDANINGSNS